MKRIVIGILAHVDAGKTTLSEALLYQSGSIRALGRVDKGSAFLDTYALERARGITIFSKQAEFDWQDVQVTLLDTPGHVDFAAEMERTLQVLDYAILLVSGADGVQAHTKTLWSLLEKYKVPVFIFINKMDQVKIPKDKLLEEVKEKLAEGCLDFGKMGTEPFYEQAAMCQEAALDSFLETGRVEKQLLVKMISNRQIFPCFFGAALKLEGINELIEGIRAYTIGAAYPEDFGARVYKIARDEQGKRLTYLKVTGGVLKVRDVWGSTREKVNQIRIYSGEKYQTVGTVYPGSICAVTGPNTTYAGQGIGCEAAKIHPLLEPVMSYQVVLPEDCEAADMLPKLHQLEEEIPELHVIWEESHRILQVRMMGQIQQEIIKSLILERFGITVEFAAGHILYKESILNTVEGVGHYEPLRHYAEVHLLLEPGEPGSGLTFETACSEDALSRNWQRLVLTHLQEKEHKGIMMGAPVTDMKITLIAGRAHQKHTEGGDFRQATYRALRQGLKEAETVLLEPYYDYRIELPTAAVGRAIADLEKMHGTFSAPINSGDFAILTGTVPVKTIQDYHTKLLAYTGGQGRLQVSLNGYWPCHNTSEVLKEAGYDWESDLENPAGSVFCSHGAGFTVSWDRVKAHMHVESPLSQQKTGAGDWENQNYSISDTFTTAEAWLEPEEVEQILGKASGANKREKDRPKYGVRKKTLQTKAAPVIQRYQQMPQKAEYLLVDGYNIIYAWPDLKELAAVNMDGARGRLLDILCNYQGTVQCKLIVVFDAYKVQGHVTETEQYHNIYVVYTKEAETADCYIEKFTQENIKNYHITVATSDGLEQVIIRGQGCRLLSAADLQEEITREEKGSLEAYSLAQPKGKNYLFDATSPETIKKMKDIHNSKDNPKE